MTTKLIAENILAKSHFLSATEQAAPFAAQPTPDAGNTGAFRLLASGDVADLVYSGTATGDGSTTTIVDSVLSALGDDYLIGATIEFTGGENTSGTATITDFAQATGTITWSGAVNSTLTGDTFTVTLPFSTREIQVELVAGGDAGTATFKWSHDGGTTWLGRDAIAQNNFVGKRTLSGGGEMPYIVEAANGDLVALFGSSGDSEILAYISDDGGLTWGAAITAATTYPGCKAPVVLASGRICFFRNNVMVYSDDHGQTWNEIASTAYGMTGSNMLLPDGSILNIGSNSYSIWRQVSRDGGLTWEESAEVIADTNDQKQATAVVAANGNIVCVYASDEDSLADFEIKCKISEDNGVTWGSVIAVANFGGTDLQYPTAAVDPSGRIYVTYRASNTIYTVYSDDHGETWSASVNYSPGGSVENISLSMVHGHLAVVIWTDFTDTYVAFRGAWEAYSANACPVAVDVKDQRLAVGVEIAWHGGAGVAGDAWTISPDYGFAASNIITDSPSRPWRSEQDDAAIAIVIDMGENVRHMVDGVGFFGCNVRTLSFQMNATDSWGSPSVDESVSFDLATGTVDAVAGNAIQDTSLLAGYKDHALKNLFFRPTSGTDDGVTWRILDNVGSYIMLDTTAAHSVGAADTFAIFQASVAKTFTGGLYRFVRIAIAAQETADGFYQIGTMVAGLSIALTRTWKPGYGRSYVYDIEMIRTPHGGLIPIKGADRKRLFSVGWSSDEDTTQEVLALVDYLEGKNIALIPDAATLTNAYLVKSIGDIRQIHKSGDARFDFTLQLEEIL